MVQDYQHQPVAAFEVDAVVDNRHSLPEVAEVVVGQKKAQELAPSIVAVTAAAAAGTLEILERRSVHHMCEDLLLKAGPEIVAAGASALVVLMSDKRQVVVRGCQKQEPAVHRGRLR